MSKTVIIKCDLCGKDLSEDEVTTAEVIMRGRTGQLDFCGECAEPLVEKLSLNGSFECPDCHKVFGKERGLKAHRARMHGTRPNWVTNIKK